MGRVRQLRRSIRASLAEYARQHPECFTAHMTAQATVWLLARRRGMPNSEQLRLLVTAHGFVSDLADEHPESDTVARAKADLDALVVLITDRIATRRAEQKFLADHAADFAAWAAQLAESEDGDPHELEDGAES